MQRFLITILSLIGIVSAGCDASKPDAAPGAAPEEADAASPPQAAEDAAGEASEEAPSPEASASREALSEGADSGALAGALEVEPPKTEAGLPKLGPWPADRRCIEQPLTEEERAVFFGTTSDAKPEVLDGARPELEGQHYLGSDEWNLHLFAEHIDDLGTGGAYVGIGTDQAYFFIGWMRPQLAWAIDYDPWVVNLHLAYAAFFKAADELDDFLYFWKRAGHALEVLEATYKDSPRYEAIVKSYKLGRQRIYNRFVRLNAKYKELKVDAFINDEEQYRYVRDLVRAGCVRTMLGNLLEETGVRGIGAASHALGIPVRAMYLSNAEMYWDYTEPYKTNIRSMNIDADSVILRTYASIPQNNDYRYNVMSFQLYLDFLAADWVEDVKDVIRFRAIKDETDVDFFISDDTPEDRYERHKARIERRKKRRRERKRREREAEKREKEQGAAP